MEISEAVDIINGMVYRPGYTIRAVDSTRRYERSVNVLITAETRDSGTVDHPDMWRENYPAHVIAPAAFNILIPANAEKRDLFKLIGLAIIEFETHEMREFLRDPDTGIAPLHPHTQAGINFWGTPEIDATYGLNSLKD